MLGVRVNGTKATLGLLAACLALGWTAGGARAAAITEFTSGLGAGAAPSAIVAGPDGNTWFGDDGCYYGTGACEIGRITPSGAITEFPVSFTPLGLILGPDGNLWSYSLYTPAVIARITPSGTVTDFTQGFQSESDLTDLVAGTDGNLWFTDEACAYGGTCAIGKITPSGTITEYPLPAGAIAPSLVAGPDGNIWFTDHGTPAVGKITPSGTITEYTAGLNPGAKPYDLVVGPDGNVWFIDSGTTTAIGRVTPSGTITEYTAGLPAGSYPGGLVAGLDGNVWFTEDGCETAANGPCAIGRITPSGTITEYSAGLSAGAQPEGLAPGIDGNLWFTADGTPAIGRITPAGTITELTAGLGANPLPGGIITGDDGNLWFTDYGTPAVGTVALQFPPAVSTGASSGVTASSALVTGAVDPLGGAVSSIVVQYGTSAAYGETATATPATLPSSATPTSVAAALTDLPAGSSIHYRLVATNAYGTAVGGDETLSTAAIPTPTITGLHQSASRWRTGHAAATIARKPSIPAGTTFTLTLNEAATVELAFTHSASGHRSGKKCSLRKKHGRRCTVPVSNGTIALTGHAGSDRIKFAGRIPGHGTLKPGRYTVRFSASAQGQTSTGHTLTFTVVK